VRLAQSRSGSRCQTRRVEESQSSDVDVRGRCEPPTESVVAIKGIRSQDGQRCPGSSMGTQAEAAKAKAEEQQKLELRGSAAKQPFQML